MTDPSGPHLNVAVICERVLMEQDGVASAIRIIDRVFFGADEDGNPIDPRYPLTVFVNFKSGAARGSHTIAVEMEKPSTEQVSVLETASLFEGEDRGVNLIVQMEFQPDGEGLYWFDVLFNGERITRMPLRVVYQRQPTVGHSG